MAGGMRSEAVYEVQVDRDVPVPMRDGTILRADVYRAAGAGPVSGCAGAPWVMSWSRAARPMGSSSLRHGYVFVGQSVRGRFASGGRFDPMRDDAWGARPGRVRLGGVGGRAAVVGRQHRGWRTAPTRA